LGHKVPSLSLQLFKPEKETKENSKHAKRYGKEKEKLYKRSRFNVIVLLPNFHYEGEVLQIECRCSYVCPYFEHGFTFTWFDVNEVCCITPFPTNVKRERYSLCLSRAFTKIHVQYFTDFNPKGCPRPSENTD